ncbi:MAG: helix-turn-helix transcriptional regulator [Lachnospiraceae bacterium]|nr:helix-turn-helix transcriptional regulator [Lachnospiraceae bacterium]
MVNKLNIRLQEQRKLSKLSQKEVAKAIGVSPSIISNYESGERTPSVECLMALAGLYRCSTDYLLGLDKTNCSSYIDTSNLSASQHKLLQDFIDTIS